MTASSIPRPTTYNNLINVIKQNKYQIPFAPGTPEWQRARKLCIRYCLPYAAARAKHFEMEALRYPEA